MTATADSVAMGLARPGYGGEHLVVMALRRRSPTGPPAARRRGGRPGRVRSAPRGRPAARTLGRRAGHRRELADFRGVLVRRVGARFFAQRVDGRIAGSCELYVRRGDRADRGRGHARGVPRPRAGARVVLRAAEAATGGGAPRVPVARSTTTGRSTSTRKLGFDPVGHGWSLRAAASGSRDAAREIHGAEHVRRVPSSPRCP